MIIGTAGHIDHGKTALVRALTGVDTDRLKEEKARGISIELGYAYEPLDNGDVLGFIDVPGHERLVRTMVAGACGIDFALLVVAADDGVMPQTREHLAILELLGITRGAVALTKIDRVDNARLRSAEAEVGAALASTSLRGAPIFPVNALSHTDPGTAALRNCLHEAAMRTPVQRDGRLFRLAVDRVFTLAGHGTVVTGTIFSGSIGVGDAAMVMPAEIPVRIRSLHTQNRVADTGWAGERCALNLVGAAANAIARGDWLADERTAAPTVRVDARLRLLADSALRLASWSPLHVHLATTHRVAHVVLLESERLSAGESARVQLVFDTAVCAMPGDRFIVRDAQAAHTVGGGVILDPYAPSRRRRSAERFRYLDALERLIEKHDVAPLLEQAPYGLAMTNLVRLTGRAAEDIPLPSDVVIIEAAAERFVFTSSLWRALRERAVAALRDFHDHAPDEVGPDLGRLRRIALAELPHALWRALVDELAREGVVMREGPWVRLPQHTVTLSDTDRALAHVLHPLIETGRFDPPWVRDLAAVVHEPEERVRQVLRKQVAQGAVQQVVHDLFYDRSRIDELAAIAAAIAQEDGAVSVARYRDTLGIGRKRAVQILEFFDRIGYTRRVRDAHVLRNDSGWR